ncbi:hypothetical protein ATCR1_06686 [Agrobacterium tumefaciens CCNWGS0286]|nr:hypothetical protein ATCR1_06686 [Agrobacterium tumefaciens CCNWGS0286]
MNTEIVTRLEESLSGEGLSAEAQKTIQQLRAEVSRLEGLNEGLGRTVRLFFEHLTLSEEGQNLVLKTIIEDEFLRPQEKKDK